MKWLHMIVLILPFLMIALPLIYPDADIRENDDNDRR